MNLSGWQGTLKVKDIKYIENQIERASAILKDEKPITKKTIINLTFGFKGDKDRLKNILQILQTRIEILNIDTCTIDDLINVLTSKNIKNINRKIYLSCETSQFAYVLEKLSNLFSKPLNPVIDNSDIFYSKRNKKITANNLYVANKNSPLPKRYEDIDNAFKGNH